MKKVLLAATLAPFLWASPVAAREFRSTVKCSGSAMTVFEDNAQGGIKTGFGILGCKSPLGRSTSQGVGHAAFAGTGTCPNGNQGIKLTLIPGTGNTFVRYDKTGDLVFSEIVSEDVCYDTSTGVLFKSGTDRITGGTGRFAGATGQSQFQGTQWTLYLDADGNAFAAQEATATGTIILRGEK